jgi:2-keto-4-pentenoate hydratase/2-oxohepta-3-ene-1,7-dioic acid hydratase in catechol pathway
MTHWIRFNRNGNTGFGSLQDKTISIFEGDMFNNPCSKGEQVDMCEVELLIPCIPGKMLALWNNFHASAEKNSLPLPGHPWYFVKTRNSFAPADSIIRKPGSCSGKILFEGELGIVMGKTCKDVAVDDIDDYIFGYTCINDVTALEYLFNEDAFAHWTRAKNFDGFGVIGPSIATGIEPDNLVVKTLLAENDDNIQERQNYPVSDMIYSPRQIASRISFDMTLEPGDVIACGTSLGAGALKDGWQVRINIEGVGELVNTYREQG